MKKRFSENICSSNVKILMNDNKKERIYHRNGFEGEYVFPLRIKPGALLGKAGCENWTPLPWFKAVLVVIILENEG
jgi:hypothetical protein